MSAITPAKLQLRIVPTACLRLHEEHDPYRVERLARAFRREGRQRNPIIVAEGVEDKSYIVLDGATRTSTLRKLGIRDALVQIVDYFSDAVELKVWHHVVVGFPGHRILSQIAELRDLHLQEARQPRGPDWLQEAHIVACITLRDQREYVLHCQGDINCQAKRLCQFVGIYKGKAEVHRTAELDMPQLLEQYPDLSAVVAFPTFTPAEIMRIAANGNKVPMGITRHIIKGRALGLGVSLEMLDAPLPLEEKNAWLQERIRQRVRANKVRFYQEPVIIFDE